MVFIDFKICLTTQKNTKPNGPQKQPKSIVYTIKIAHLNLKHFVQANLDFKKLHFRVFESESTQLEPNFFIPDNQDPIFAGYGYNLHVIFIYACEEQRTVSTE